LKTGFFDTDPNGINGAFYRKKFDNVMSEKTDTISAGVHPAEMCKNI